MILMKSDVVLHTFTFTRTHTPLLPTHPITGLRYLPVRSRRARPSNRGSMATRK